MIAAGLYRFSGYLGDLRAIRRKKRPSGSKLPGAFKFDEATLEAINDVSVGGAV